MSNHKLLILCGGKGTRLKSVWTKPKILAPIGNSNYLDLLLRNISNTKVNLEVILATGYLSSEIEAYLTDKKININVIREEEELGTGGAVVNYLKSYSVERFSVMNGDTIYSKLDLENYFNGALGTANNTVGVVKKNTNDRYGSVELKDRLTIFRSQEIKINDTVFAGILTISSKYLKILPNFPFSLEELINFSRIPANFVEAIELRNGFFDIGTPEALRNVQQWKESY